MPEGVADGIVEGLYRWADAPEGIDGPKATILFSGTAHGAARDAQAELAEHYGVGAELWSATGATSSCARRPWPWSGGTGSTRPSQPAPRG